MVITPTRHSKIVETKNERFSLRLRVENGSSEFVKDFMRKNDGERPSREEIDQHVAWTNLFVIADEQEPLQKLLNKLRHGKRHSMVVRFSRPALEWEGRHEEDGNVLTSQNLTTGIRYLEGYDQSISQFVPVQALCR